MALPPEKLRAYGLLIDILVDELLRDAHPARNDIAAANDPEPKIVSAQKAERAASAQVDRPVADDRRRG